MVTLNNPGSEGQTFFSEVRKLHFRIPSLKKATDIKPFDPKGKSILKGTCYFPTIHFQVLLLLLLEGVKL